MRKHLLLLLSTAFCLLVINSKSSAQCSINPVADLTVCDAPVLLVSSSDTDATFSGPGVSYISGPGTGSQTFNYTNDVQTYVVPAGVTAITIEAYGAQGGECSAGLGASSGGLGGYVTGVLSVTPGEVLNVYVGGQGIWNGPGGYNGGGTAENNSYGSGGGGGSDVRAGGTDLTDRVIVAGGGGGGTCGSMLGDGGAGGGLVGVDGISQGGFGGGTGGTQSAGGLRGCCYSTGGDGSLGQGGGISNDYHNAGGGGGYYGGGSGAAYGSSGGGSSYIGGATSGNTIAGVRSGDGEIIISYNQPSGYFFDPSVAGSGIQTIAATCMYGVDSVNITVTNNTDPCTTIISMDCGVGQTTSLSDGCSYWQYETCWQGLGKEQIYQITPSSSGDYILDIMGYNSVAGDYTEFAYKDASLGCGASDWTCIGSWNSPGSVATLTLVGGTTYYVLLDRTNNTTGGNNIVSWMLECPDPSPCTSIQTITDCGLGTIYKTLTSTGYWTNESSCGWTLAGAEQMYEFTPSVSGSYQIYDDTNGDDYVSWSYKNASLGCDMNNWNCITIDDWNTTGLVATVSLNAGTSDYILLDREDSWSGGDITEGWRLECPPPSACSSIQTITDCGQGTMYATLSTSGYWTNETGCGWTLAGGEQIYEFTPSVTGNYKIYDDTNGDDYVGWSFKDASLGCDMNNWNCLTVDDWNTTGLIANVSLTAGTSYYFLLDREDSWNGGDITEGWHLECPPPDPCTAIITATCGNIENVTLRTESVWSGESGCGWGLNGGEQIYQFTANITGTYTIETDDWGGDYTAFSYKDASMGCDINNWNCIGINYPYNIGTVGTINLDAGSSYYILLDREDAWTGSDINFDWDIQCPAGDPCTSVQTISSCGTNNNITLFSASSWTRYDNYNGFYTNGGEQLYYYVPSTTGNYTVDVSNESGNVDYINLAYKDVSYGCDINNWNVVSNIYGTGTYGPFTLNAGIPYYILLDKTNATGSSPTTLDWQITCPPDPCSSIITTTCGSVQNITLSSVSAWNSESGCGWGLNGGEQIYQLTAATTGTYNINIDSYDGDYTSFSYKDAALGCDLNNWNCLGINYPYSTGTLAYVNLDAGTTYYILLDREDAWTGSDINFDWDISCPPLDPCASINTVNTCGEPETTTLSSVGSWTYEACGQQESGQEMIYQFSPLTTATYTFEVTSASDDYISFAYKDASGGCGNYGWNCMGYAYPNSTGTIGSVALSSGYTYYILLDKWNNTTLSPSTLTWDIVCPVPSVDYSVNAPGTWTGSTCGMTNDVGLQPTEDVEYAVTISCPGNYQFSLCGSSYNTWLALGTTVGTADLNLNDDYCDAQSSFISYIDSAGTYYVTVEGNADCGSYSLDIREIDAPVIISYPDTQTVYSDITCETALLDYTPMVNATDNCSFTLNQSPAAGTTLSGVGSTLVTITATDESGNSSAVNFDVVVRFIADQMGDTYGTLTNVSGNAWYLVNINGKIVGAINPNGNNLGDVEVGMHEDMDVVTDPVGHHLLQRWWYINPQNDGSFVTPVSIQLFLTNLEINDLIVADQFGEPNGSALAIYKYDGPGEDNLDLTQQQPEPAGVVTTIDPTQIVVNDYCDNGKFLSFDVSGFSTFTIRQLGSSLPIELLNFNANKQADNTLLTWSTQTETNNDHFDVEVATISDQFGALQFRKIGTVQGAGNSSGKLSYQLLDTEPNKEGVRYYRLKQVDFNGKYTYSEVKPVVFGSVAISNVQVAPNPFNAVFNLMINSTNTGTADLQVYDVVGHLVYSGNAYLNIGINKTEIALDKSLASGVYMLSVKFNGEEHNIRIVKAN